MSKFSHELDPPFALLFVRDTNDVSSSSHLILLKALEIRQYLNSTLENEPCCELAEAKEVMFDSLDHVESLRLMSFSSYLWISEKLLRPY